MENVYTNSVEDIDSAVRSFLEEDEAINNVPLGVMNRIIDNPKSLLNVTFGLLKTRVRP